MATCPAADIVRGQAPGKTEFPPGWTDQQIIEAVLSVARDPETGVITNPH